MRRVPRQRHLRDLCVSAVKLLMTTAIELDNIRSDLARTTASLEITRAATDGKIEYIRSIASSSGAVTFTPMAATSAPVGAGLRSTTSNEVAFAPVEVSTSAVSYMTNEAGNVQYADPHLELADLLLSR